MFKCSAAVTLSAVLCWVLLGCARAVKDSNASDGGVAGQASAGAEATSGGAAGSTPTDNGGGGAAGTEVAAGTAGVGGTGDPVMEPSDSSGAGGTGGGSGGTDAGGSAGAADSGTSGAGVIDDTGGAAGMDGEGGDTAVGDADDAGTAGTGQVADVTGAGLTAGTCTLGAGVQMGAGQTDEQYLSADVTRDGHNYRMITNGWGMNWQSHDISWLGTSLSINSYEGERQSNGAPAGYPSVFCGRYSDTSEECGLPRALSEVTALNTAASWSHPANDGTYNVAYDVWFGDASGTGFRQLQSYFMVWLKDPAGESPAGSLLEEGVTVEGAAGVWNIIAGTVNNLPIVNYVRAEGDETQAIAFDIMDFVRDAQARNLEFPGNDVLAIAIGFEIWQGPVTNLALEDFCIDIE